MLLKQKIFPLIIDEGGRLNCPHSVGQFYTKMNNIRFLSLPEVKEHVGLSTSTIYDRISKGTFPRSHKISPRIVVWNEFELDQWCKELMK